MDPRGHRHQLEPRFREDSSASGVRSRAVQLLELTAAECPDLLLWTVRGLLVQRAPVRACRAGPRLGRETA